MEGSARLINRILITTIVQLRQQRKSILLQGLLKETNLYNQNNNNNMIWSQGKRRKHLPDANNERYNNN